MELQALDSIEAKRKEKELGGREGLLVLGSCVYGSNISGNIWSQPLPALACELGYIFS